ncbi:MAG: MtaA/CmuA family methyltransferase [Chloroflexi bacterium]|nr:MtaA/CmuA family methyltransferase [Chloroflexota bacterium]
MTLNSRERVLRLFERKEIDYVPVFSGMGNVTVHGLKKYGYKFAEIHTDARKMANMAASTYQLFGFESAVVPFDLGTEAEALGCPINYYSHHAEGVIYPTVKQPLTEEIAELDVQIPADLAKRGRIPVVCEAIRLLKKEVGDEITIGISILGPYTILAQVTDVGPLAKACFKQPQVVSKALDKMTDLIIQLSKIYQEAGADFSTIREMGAGPGILSPRVFASLIHPQLKRIFANVELPSVLHICGNVKLIVDQMVTCGAAAISIEEKMNIAETRKNIPADTIILGNIAGYDVLVHGKPADVDRVVKEAITNGVNGIWPGCDIWPEVPEENMKALMASARKYGKLESC